MGQLELWQSSWNPEANQLEGTANTLRKAQGKEERNGVGITPPEFLNLGTSLSAGFFYEK